MMHFTGDGSRLDVLLSRDGARGSTLTAQAESLLSVYHEALDAARGAASGVLDKYRLDI